MEDDIEQKPISIDDIITSMLESGKDEIKSVEDYSSILMQIITKFSDFPDKLEREIYEKIIVGSPASTTIYRNRKTDVVAVRMTRTESSININIKYPMRSGTGKIINLSVSSNNIKCTTKYYSITQKKTTHLIQSEELSLTKQSEEEFLIKYEDHCIRKTNDEKLWIQDSKISSSFDENGIEMSNEKEYVRYPVQAVATESAYDFNVTPEVLRTRFTRVGIDLVKSEELFRDQLYTSMLVMDEDTPDISRLGHFTFFYENPEEYVTPPDKLEAFRKRNLSATNVLEAKYQNKKTI